MNIHQSGQPRLNDDSTFIVGLGSFLPGEPVTNAVIAERLPEVPVLDLMRYFGVEQRHLVVDPGTGARIEKDLGSPRARPRS